MTDYEKCALLCYDTIGTLNETHNIQLVQHNNSKEVFVKKTLTSFNRDVYAYLKSHYIPGTAKIFETIEDEGKLIVIEEYISGQTIQSTLDNGNVFPIRDAVDITYKLCQIVKRLHCSTPPIVHRDIKPSNVTISSNGSVTLLDMNAAKVYSKNTQKDTSLLGTVGYAAPEQYGFGASGFQSDIYAIGILLNEMITGKTTIESARLGMIGKIIDKCTKIDPKDRYQSITNLMKDLKATKVLPNSGKLSLFPSKYALPGFRTGRSLNMVIAGIVYAIIFLLTLSLEGGNGTAMSLWLNRATCFLCCISFILFSCNYLNVWEIFQINNIKSRSIKFLAIIGYNFLIWMVLFLILEILDR